ncbi:MAG: HAD family phosphatase [Endomicrobiaceae bacterium]|nr:HAD family phosphatase [Endomicrobiaceae bacterium]
MININKKFKAVLFDMDGVIVDSMPYHFISWFEALQQYGITVTPFDIYAKEGEKSDICINYFFAKKNVTIDSQTIKEVLNLRNKIFQKYFKLRLFKDIEPILKELHKKGILLAIVTGSSRNKVVSILPKKISKIFDVIISADMLKQGKPFPEPYLMAAEKLKVKPSQCMVIENAPYGIRSAKAAKMYCIAVTTGLPKQYLKQADKICDSLSDIFK